MNAAELREALDLPDYDPNFLSTEERLIFDAARLWLRILEGDEQTVEKVARVVADELDTPGKPLSEYDRLFARAVLAALAEGEKK